MKSKINYLKEYLDTLTADTGWQIIIEDFYGVLRRHKEIAGYLSENNWHTNPYCMLIKQNTRLWKRCVALKHSTRRSIRKRGKPDFSICYCGVAEYTVPIFVGGVHIATLCAAGFLAPLSDKMTEILSRKTQMSQEEFRLFREKHLREQNAQTEKKLCSYLNIAANIIEEWAKDSPLIKSAGRQGEPDEKQRYVLKALDHIEKHYFEDITPQSVAERYHISLSYLQHLFLKYAGEGIAAAIRRKRLERACLLLAETNRSVCDIAVSCGFFDTDYFSVIFRRNFGVTPLAFRKRHRN